jgi:uncharacterized membrane protein
MPSRPTRKPAVLPRDQAFWLGAAVLVLGQLAAFWMLCSEQVRKAEVRSAALQVERLALADCLRSVPHASLTSCAQRSAPPGGRAQALAGAPADAAASVVPVNYVYQ